MQGISKEMIVNKGPSLAPCSVCTPLLFLLDLVE